MKEKLRDLDKDEEEHRRALFDVAEAQQKREDLEKVIEDLNRRDLQRAEEKKVATTAKQEKIHKGVTNSIFDSILQVFDPTNIDFRMINPDFVINENTHGGYTPNEDTHEADTDNEGTQTKNEEGKERKQESHEVNNSTNSNRSSEKSAVTPLQKVTDTEKIIVEEKTGSSNENEQKEKEIKTFGDAFMSFIDPTYGNSDY